MTDNKPSGLKAPAKRTTGLVKPKTTSNPASTASSASAERPPKPAEATPPSKNDLKIGDRVLVSGNKPGRVQYLGETQFAAGQWAGVVLDEAVGKNDGSVAGVKYFQCEPLHGVFARPSKLVKVPNQQNSGSAGAIRKTASSTFATPAKVKTVPLTAAALKSMETPKTASKTKSVRSPASSIRSLRLGLTTAPPGGNSNLQVGDRVIVSGNRIGVVRYLGETEFASGTWVGVELDDALGKNDGTVQGKRYFNCKNMHGLFAPIHKVKKTGSAPTPARGTRQRRLSNASSNASLGSISSIRSSSRNSKSLRSEVSSQYQKKVTPSGMTALQEALKEKQQHVEELLAERDLERAEIMETQQINMDTKRQLELFKEDHASKELQINELKVLIEKADEEKVALRRQLEAEKQKFEDLQFSLEEQQIIKDDVQASGVDGKIALKELEESRDKAIVRAQELAQRVSALELELSNLQVTTTGNTDEISERLKQTVVVLQEAQANSAKHEREIEQLKQKLQAEIQAKEVLQISYDELDLDKGSLQSSIKELEKYLEDYKTKYTEADLQINQLKSDNEQLAREKNDLIHAGGDSSAQVEILKQSLTEKANLIEELQKDITNKQAECTETQKQQEGLTNENATLESESNLLRTKLNELLLLKEDFSMRIKETHSALLDSQSKLAESQENQRQVEVAMMHLQEEKVEADKHMLQLEEDNKKNVKALQDIQDEITKLKTDNEKLTTELNSSTKDVGSTKVLLQNLQIEKDTICSTLNEEQNKCKELSNSLDDVQRKLETAESSLKELGQKSGSETQNLVAKIQEQAAKYSQLQEEFLKVQSLVEELRSAKEKSQEEIESVTVHLSNAENKCKELQEKFETEKSNLEQDLSSLKNSLQTLQDEEIKLKDKLEEESSKYEELLSTKDELVNDKKASENKVSELNSEIEKLHEEHKNASLKYEEAVETLKQEHETRISELSKNLQSSDQEKSMEIEKLQENLKQASKQLEDVTTEKNKKIEECEQQYKNLEQEHQTNCEQLSNFQDSITQLGQSLKIKSAEVEDAKTTVEELTSQKISLVEEIASLNRQLTEVKDTVAMKESEISAKNDAMEKLCSEKNELQKTLDENENTLSTCANQRKQQETAIAELNGKVESLESIITDLNVEISSKDADITKLNGDKSSLEKQLTAQLEESKGKCVKLEKSLKGATENIVTLNCAIEEKQKSLASNEEEIAKLQKEKSELVESEKNAKKEISSLSEEVKMIENERVSLTNKLSLVESTGSDIEEKAKVYLSKIQAQEEDKIKLETEIQQMNNEISEHKKSLDEATAKTNSLQNSLEETITRYKEEIAAFKARETSLEEEKDLLVKEVAELKSTIQNLQGSINTASQENSSATEKISALEHQIKTLSEKAGADSSSLNEQLALKDDEIKTLNESVVDLKAQVEQFKADLSANDKLHSEARSSLEAIQVELKTTVDERNTAKEENEKLKEDYQTLENVKNTVESELRATLLEHTNQNDSLKQELAQTREKFTAQIEGLESTKKSLEVQLEDARKLQLETEAAKKALGEKFEELEAETNLCKTENVNLQASLGEKQVQLEKIIQSQQDSSGQMNVVMEELKKSIQSEQEKVLQLQNDLNAKVIENDSMQITLNEKEKINAELNTNVQELSSKIEGLTTDLTQQTRDHELLQAQIESLEASLKENETKSNKEMQEQLEQLKIKYNEATSTAESYTAQINNLSEKLKQSEETGNKLNGELETARNELIQSQESFINLEKSMIKSQEENSQLKVQVESMQMSSQETDGVTAQLHSVLQEKNVLSKEVDSIKEQFEHTRKTMLEQDEREKELRSKILILEADLKMHGDQSMKYEQENKLLNELKLDLEGKLEKMQKSAAESDERETVLKREFTRERESLQSSLDITNTIVDEKSKEINQYLHEISLLKSENTMVESLKETITALEMRKSSLERELRDAMNSQSKPSSNNGDSGTASEDQQSQIDFLNSIIVDQQTKVEELNERIKELESMLVNGEDINQSLIEQQVANEFNPEKGRRAAPRLFCDICDIFDAHETEDCPSQSSAVDDMSGLPQPVHNVSKRGEVREYCDNCEMFGHDTEDCTEDADEMF